MSSTEAVRERRFANAIIVAVLAVMMATPISYYFVREDKNDERFAWRMFSSIRMLRCEPRFAIGEPGRDVPLYQTFHEAWITLAQRGRGAVLDAMGEKLCADHPGQRVTLSMSCRHVDGKQSTVFDGSRDLCGEDRP